MENWKDINGFVGYYKISDKGNIMSLERRVAHPRAKCGYVIKPSQLIRKRKSNKGVVLVALYRDTKKMEIPLNRLVYENFVGPIPVGYYCHNTDEDRWNNAASNIHLSAYMNYHKDPDFNSLG